MPLTLTLSRKALNNVDDVAGRWQFEGGSLDENKKHIANYASIKRVKFQGTDQDGQNTASVTTTVFFIGSHPPESITLEGAHDFNSGNETGSVSAASHSQRLTSASSTLATALQMLSTSGNPLTATDITGSLAAIGTRGDSIRPSVFRGTYRKERRVL